MFDFRIINLANGDQVIDPSLKTPYDSLTPVQMLEYMEMDNRLACMDNVRQKAKKDAGHRQKLERNPLYRMACLFGVL